MVYKNKKTISFPIGGIGTGCIGLAGNGSLVDWEIFNRPNKNSLNGYSHFAIKVTQAGKSITKVLHGDTDESYMGAHDEKPAYVGFGFGPHSVTMAGYPHFKNVDFDGTFPIAHVNFSEDGFPIVARMTAFNPFIPHDDYNSSLPAAFFKWELENLSDMEVECTLAFTLRNPADCSQNEEVTVNGRKGLLFTNAGKNKDEIGYSDLCVVTDGSNSSVQEYWYRGGWCDPSTTYWKNLSELDRMPTRAYDEAGKRDHGVVASYVKIPAKDKATVRFVLAWNVPNQYNYWRPYKNENGDDVTWKNYYATQFENSKAVAEYSIKNFTELYDKTLTFTKALWECSLPESVIDAISANLSVLKSPTVLRLEDGSIWAWEGCNEARGSCEGSCQHVWNYAYALPFLFPKLERTLRENTIKYSLSENGETKFRIMLPFEREKWNHRACVDGQMGEIIKCYREWKISGDDEWIRRYANDIFKMLEYAWSEENPDKWDADKDGVMEGRQHHTLDMELFGANSWLEGFYLLALDCAAQIADFVGDNERSQEYKELYEKGKIWTNEFLFNGRYFCQKIDLTDKNIIDGFNAQRYWNDEAKEIKYQVADGSIIDQMLSDWHAAIIGCKGVFDNDKKKIALENLYRNNYKQSMRDVTNMWRNFALNDESGTIICSYPDGISIPAIPVPYCEECMTGFEYSLAGLMIVNGFVKEGETMVKAVRDRYDGERRNPWNEIECGSNYARSMASFALLPIYSGFSFDMSKKHIGFFPISNEDGRYLWSVGNTWGTIVITKDKHVIEVYGEPLTVSSYGIQNSEQATAVTVDGKDCDFNVCKGLIKFDTVSVVQTMEVKIK